MTDKASPPLRFQTFSVRAWRPLNGFWEVGGAAGGPASYPQYPAAADVTSRSRGARIVPGSSATLCAMEQVRAIKLAECLKVLEE